MNYGGAVGITSSLVQVSQKLCVIALHIQGKLTVLAKRERRVVMRCVGELSDAPRERYQNGV